MDYRHSLRAYHKYMEVVTSLFRMVHFRIFSSVIGLELMPSCVWFNIDSGTGIWLSLSAFYCWYGIL